MSKLNQKHPADNHTDDDEDVYDAELELLNEMIALNPKPREGINAHVYMKWLDLISVEEKVDVILPRRYRQRERSRKRERQQEDDEQVPLEAYARLPREFCEAPRQSLKPFEIAILGAALISAKAGEDAVTRRDLLRRAGAGWGTSQWERLGPALDALLNPVGNMAAPLRSFDMDEGPIALDVDPTWLPNSNYVRVAWPPPKDALACSLYLWLAARKPRRNDPRACSLKSVLEDLGYAGDHPGRDLMRALAALNEHCERQALIQYEMQTKGNKVRFSRGGVANTAKWCRQRRKVVL